MNWTSGLYIQGIDQSMNELACLKLNNYSNSNLDMIVGYVYPIYVEYWGYNQKSNLYQNCLTSFAPLNVPYLGQIPLCRSERVQVYE